MNQSKSKTIRRIFESIRPFPEGDPRNKTQLRLLKKRYNAVSRPNRFAFLDEMQGMIRGLERRAALEQGTAIHQAAEQAATSITS